MEEEIDAVDQALLISTKGTIGIRKHVKHVRHRRQKRLNPLLLKWYRMSH